tara:strand:- start:404 stop:1402 length:999 start_codon:yes stop_codon:yes gene_type:complete
MNATIKLESTHYPVLLNELISIISPLYGGTFIDCTFGQGGYSSKILENKLNNIIALDRDRKVNNFANILSKKYKNRFNFFNKKFSEIDKLKIKKENIKGIIFDLGYSMNQVKDLSTGISFKSTSQLDMKMGLNDLSADYVINQMRQENIYKIFKYFGEEKRSKVISKNIINQRKIKNLNTNDLVQLIEKSLKGYSKTHKATKIFQALRIFVNKEISELIYGLINSFKILPIGGVLVVVTFHSIEDSIVKFFFKNYSTGEVGSRYFPRLNNKKKLFNLVKKKPTSASISEIKNNPSSRSAKLRYAFKMSENNDFIEFINKFKFLLEIENLERK